MCMDSEISNLDSTSNMLKGGGQHCTCVTGGISEYFPGSWKKEIEVEDWK